MAHTSTRNELLRKRRVDATVAELVKVLTDQRQDVQARLDSHATTLLSKAWDQRLAEVIGPVNLATAREVALRVARALAGKGHGYDPDVMTNWLTLNAGIAAESVNDSTRASLAAAQETDDPDPVGSVFDLLLTSGVASLAVSMVTTAVNFAAHDAAQAVGAQYKTWNTGRNPRPRHAALNGQVVALDSTFSNGARYPGDPTLGPADLARCNCSMTIST
ncbi:MAG: hypothetical protein HZY75_13335 [Nocardioidaceae bacterium]|nr:MAG: hypothetical protein HZY75_13335 [Nocardioidaceae bacterium]